LGVIEGDIAMATLRILIADDQIPPAELTEQEFRDQFFRQYGNSEQNRKFIDQCAFMGQVVQALRDSGYRLTTARTFDEATKHISGGDFDLAIVDLGWYMDFTVPEHERPSAGWSLCEKLDQKATERGTRIPQILFSSRFPTHPELSRDAARQQKLPLFKEATPVVLNSLMAAVGFVEATLAGQRSQDATNPHRFTRELQDVAVGFFKEAMADYRRWALLALVFVAVSLVTVLAGVLLAFRGAIAVATLSSITSLLCTTIAALLYKRLDSAQKSVETARREVLKELQKLDSKGA
jgi:hypothetical protein